MSRWPKHRKCLQRDRTEPERLAVVAKAVRSLGLPESLVGVVADGLVWRLTKAVWDRYNDTFMDADEVERVVGWTGRRRVLARALFASGHLREVNGVVCAVRSMMYTPTAVQWRWDQEDPALYKAAVARMGTRDIWPIPDPDQLALGNPTPEWRFEVMDRDLFGNPISQEAVKNGPTSTTKPPTGQPGHREFVQWWEAEYQQHNGRKYIWQKRDFGDITKLLEAAQDFHKLTTWASRYLAERDPFYRGHALSKLLLSINRFAAADPIRDTHGSQAGDSIGFDPERIDRNAHAGRNPAQQAGPRGD